MAQSTTDHANSRPILNLNLRPFFLLGLWLLLFTTPFMRGLFFRPELLLAHMIAAIAFAFCVYDQALRREIRFMQTPMDWAMFALVFAYLLSLITAVHTRQAVGELFKYIVYFMVYWMAYRAIRGSKDIDRLLIVSYITGVGVAVIGLGAAAGILNFPGAFENGVVMSTLQYKNALAIYLVAINIIGLGLSVKTEHLIPKLFFAAGNLLMVVVILATQSRGGWVMYPLAMTAFISLIPFIYRWRAAYHLVIFLGCGLVTTQVFFTHLQEVQGFAVIKYLLFGLAAAMVFQLLYHLLALWLNRDAINENTRRMVAIGGISYLSFVLAIYLWFAAAAFPVALAKILPGKVISSAATISGHDSNFQDRLEYSRDALHIVKDYPITGAGGGGWNALYHQYASNLYWTTETHNHFFQTWVEAGTIGFIALIVVWVGFIWLLVRFKLRDAGKGLSVSIWAAAVAALTIGIHSAFDFDLSMAAIGIFLYILLGAVQGTSLMTLGTEKFQIIRRKVKGKTESQAPTVSPNPWKIAILAITGTLVSVAIFYPSYIFYGAGVSGAQAARALLAKDLQTAKNLYEQAHRTDPFTASYAADLAQVLAVQAVNADDAVARYHAINYARKAAALEPYNTQVRTTLFNVYSLLREHDMMILEAEALLKANPLLAIHYEILATAYLDAARYQLKEGDHKKAQGHLQQILNILDNLPKIITQPTPALYLSAGQAAYLMGNLPEATRLLSLASQSSKEDIALNAKLWLSATYTRQGQNSQSTAILDDLKKKKPELVTIYNEILSLPTISAEP